MLRRRREAQFAAVVVVVSLPLCAGVVVVVVEPAAWPSAMACSSAANVAGSTAPVGGTPSAVWKSIKAWVSSGVYTPSIGPVQYPASLSAVWTDVTLVATPATVVLAMLAKVASSAALVAWSTKPVEGRPLSL